MKKLIVIFTALFLISACSLPYKPAVLEPQNSTFYGIHPQTIGTKESTVIMIHGMCHHDRNWVESNLSQVASRLEMQYGGLSKITQKDNKVEVYKARLNDDNDNLINFYTIVYSSLTLEVKKEKLWGRDVSPPKKIFGPLQKGERKRGKLNRWVKGKMLNDCFADALIYLGKQGQDIREGVRKAIDVIEADAKKETPLFLISESLGSKVLRDALVCDNKINVQKAEQRLGFVGNTIQVFLFANQLPLLNEGNNLQCPSDEQFISSNGRSPRSDNSIFNLIEIIEANQKKQGFVTSKLPIKVVSFTDPNDILSYEIAPDHYKNRNVVNVLVSNSNTYLGLFSNPISAHTGYLFNKDVTNFLKCGKGLNNKRSCK